MNQAKQPESTMGSQTTTSKNGSTLSALGEDQDSGEFVNTGLERWEEERAKWLQLKSGRPSSGQQPQQQQQWATDVNVDEVIDIIFSNRWRTAVEQNSRKKAFNPNSDQPDEGAFPQPVPLPQMVDILVDLWEAEGLEI